MTQMKPAIFNTAMVRAILDDRKTNTRRPFSKYLKKVIDAAYAMGEIRSNGIDSDFDDSDKKYLMAFAPHKVGDIIYVRETWGTCNEYELFGSGFPNPEKVIKKHVVYRADNVSPPDDGKWKPSIHMPKEYARLFLRVKDVRIERLNEISADDACKEGLDWKDYWCDNGQSINDPREWFKTLWESIYGNGSFDNRYVWVIEFEVISKEEAING